MWMRIKKQEIGGAAFSLSASPRGTEWVKLCKMWLLRTIMSTHLNSATPNRACAFTATTSKVETWLMHRTHHQVRGQGHSALLNRPCYLIHGGSLCHQNGGAAGKEGAQKSCCNWNCQTSKLTDVELTTKVKEEQTQEFGFPSEGWDKIKTARTEQGRQKTTEKEQKENQGRGECFNNHTQMQPWPSCSLQRRNMQSTRRKANSYSIFCLWILT